MSQENQEQKNKDIHKKLAEVLAAVGTNANQISKQLGMDRPDKFYKLLKGAAKPSFSTIAQIIGLYPQINANYFFKDDVSVIESSSEGGTHVDGLLDMEIRHLKKEIPVEWVNHFLFCFAGKRCVCKIDVAMRASNPDSVQNKRFKQSFC